MSLWKPELFVLSPQGLSRSETNNDVCLATNFRPKTGEMVLNFHNSSQTVSTSEAVLSLKEKSYFFAGFNTNTIKSCELLGESAQRKEPEPEIPCKSRDHDDQTPRQVEPDEPCVDLHPEKSKLNFYLVVMNAVRVVFIKTLAFNTIFTIRAVLF
ncbi:uncharacterized protein AKAME5_002413600 [Lates japonicus]|uniref:Uncharacterized protein n=1 Tax=Lates japonicus TaxID=270547 RepID=A0AAD3RLH7_LATJO|nr:uncharacterized protein AKAME5_002413600 [Lates japonicus]